MTNVFRYMAAMVAAVAITMLPVLDAAAQQKVLKFIPQADLRILDPSPTRVIARNPT
jgi:hypothetical protein